MKETAVEWLYDNLLPEPWTEEHFKHNSECWDKALEMEKENIIDAYQTSHISMMTAEQYYNETFKSE